MEKNIYFLFDKHCTILKYYSKISCILLIINKQNNLVIHQKTYILHLVCDKF